MMNIPQGLSDILTSSTHEPSKPQLSNRFLNYRLRRIIHNEYHAIDTNIEAVELLKIIQRNLNIRFHQLTLTWQGELLILDVQATLYPHTLIIGLDRENLTGFLSKVRR